MHRDDDDSDDDYHNSRCNGCEAMCLQCGANTVTSINIYAGL